MSTLSVYLKGGVEHDFGGGDHRPMTEVAAGIFYVIEGPETYAFPIGNVLFWTENKADE